ncbi:MAG: N-acetylmuramoyl-L-alanine amidase [Saprospiraceae bacterium]|nr:N-acetylmuramoyl-L-alanine amidase [Saprospiraceae bacterium]
MIVFKNAKINQRTQMSIKQTIKCLTLLVCFLPSINLIASVKDILNYDKNESDLCLVHNHIVTEIHEIEFVNHRFDGKDIVVIDAGHGGHDPGALGKKSKEKSIALEIALKIGNDLKVKDPNLTVIYTRTKDVFIPLHKRIHLANQEKADLFISIHCNYVSNPHVCGTETFVMGLHRAEENLNVAKRENSSVLLENEYESNYEGYDPNSPVGHILLSMFQNIYLDRSIELASNVESYLSKRKKTKSRGVKQAGFVVLRQATMPSVLVETGFLSNPQEEKYLMSEKGQIEMASSISKGIVLYFDNDISNDIPQEVVEISQTEDTDKFIIQVGAFSKPIDFNLSTNLSKHGTLIKNEDRGLYKYAVGFFNNKEQAIDACQQLKNDGFPDAFVKSFDKSVTK